MKNLKFTAVIMFLVFAIPTAFSQGITRKPFLDIGDKPVANNQFIQGNQGGSYFNTKSIYNEQTVKEIIKTQKEQGFKKVDKANFLLADVNMLQASYPLEAGYTYRIFSVFELPNGSTILRVKDESGKELVPEVRNKEIGSLLSSKISSLHLQDIVCSKNQTVYIENGMMTEKSVYYATTYLIFKKKS